MVKESPGCDERRDEGEKAEAEFLSTVAFDSEGRVWKLLGRSAYAHNALQVSVRKALVSTSTLCTGTQSTS